jgi:hypothetical protein
MSRMADVHRKIGDFSSAKALDEFVVANARALEDQRFHLASRRNLVDDLVGLEELDAASAMLKRIAEDARRELGPGNDLFPNLDTRKGRRSLRRLRPE